MTSSAFRFSTSILARLGEELNQAPDQSILELIKNAFDADATRCSIELINTSAPGGTVRISDNGHGMDGVGIRDGWLVLGKSAKVSTTKTALGRTPAGSKGLGRLAALRLGRQVRMTSIPKTNKRRQFQIDINWNLFDASTTVEGVPLEIKATKNAKGGHGTVIEIQDLRTELTVTEVRSLARSSLLLTDPFGEAQSGFVVELKAPEFKDVEKLVRQKYFDDAEYHLHAEVDESGIATAKILDWRGHIMASAAMPELRPKGHPFSCPAAVFDFWVFLLKTSDFTGARKSRIPDIRTWLGSFGGVHVYQDGVRVHPYGNPGDDWLQLNLSRAKSPEERPSTNNSIGRIALRNVDDKRLIQKTDRSGYIDNVTYRELQSFAKGALDWLARFRLDAAELRRQRDRQAPAAAPLQRTKFEAAVLGAPPRVRKVLTEAFDEYARTRDKEATSLRREVQLYRTLSTAGIVGATFAHESHGNPIKVIELATGSLRTRINKVVDNRSRAALIEPVDKISKATDAIATLGSATLSLVRASKRRVGRVDIHCVISDLVLLLLPFLEGRETKLTTSFASGAPYLRGSEAAVESIFANLINNALNAFRRDGTKHRQIVISSRLDGKECEVRVADSGAGINDVKLSDIWLPGITTEVDGTGLGLTIVRDTVVDLGGTVDAVAKGSLGGAEIIVRLPVLGA
ncbi:sensor histidine kinase [Sinimarinibacterium flocculans]|uniref:sensor histidine kinase n=1 Tax=Sinimarinibacterium flocculans TaxID=985250 RepID=UPI0035159EC3